MLYHYPAGLTAVVVRAYTAPYPDPIRVRAGDPVHIDAERSAATDVVGWLWCRAADGRAGWTPAAWIDGDGRMVREFDAVELTVAAGDTVALLFAESGFVRCIGAAGREGWLPDGVLELAAEADAR